MLTILPRPIPLRGSCRPRRNKQYNPCQLPPMKLAAITAALSISALSLFAEQGQGAKDPHLQEAALQAERKKFEQDRAAEEQRLISILSMRAGQFQEVNEVIPIIAFKGRIFTNAALYKVSIEDGFVRGD